MSFENIPLLIVQIMFIRPNTEFLHGQQHFNSKKKSISQNSRGEHFLDILILVEFMFLFMSQSTFPDQIRSRPPIECLNSAAKRVHFWIKHYCTHFFLQWKHPPKKINKIKNQSIFIQYCVV